MFLNWNIVGNNSLSPLWFTFGSNQIVENTNGVKWDEVGTWILCKKAIEPCTVTQLGLFQFNEYYI